MAPPSLSQRLCFTFLVHISLLLPHHHLSVSALSQFDTFTSKVASAASPLTSTSLSSPTQCALWCQARQPCVAFNHLSNNLCRLLTDSIYLEDGSLTPLTDDPGSMFGVRRVNTCLQLKRQRPSAPSGVYNLSGWPVPVLCDQELDGGGWTLVLSSVSQTWTPGDSLELVTGRNEDTPSMTDDYSILEIGGRLLGFSNGDRFLYRLEAQVESGRQQWGGIWSAPLTNTLVHYAPDVATELVTRFSTWSDSSGAVENRLPWINDRFYPTGTQPQYVLTTSADNSFWGTLVSKSVVGHQHSPWMASHMPASGNVLYWVREDE